MEQKQHTFRELTCWGGPRPAGGHGLQAVDATIQCPAAVRLTLGLWRKQHSLLKGLPKAKKEAPHMGKPEVVKPCLWDMIRPARDGGQHGGCL